MSETIKIDYLETKTNQKLGIITLNRAKALNSIDLDMVSTIRQQLQKWHNNNEISAVILHGVTHRAFSAGGDLNGLYKSMKAQKADNNPWNNHYGRDFFKVEYHLDYLIHTYKKPVIALGFGILMGGGIGLFNGASHRVVGPNTRYAMPEIAIGLFPDVAGSWSLSRLPNGVSHTLALTGAHINGADAYFLGLADYLVDESTETEAIFEALKNENWANCPYRAASRALMSFQQPSLTKLGVLVPHYAELRELGCDISFESLCKQFTSWAKLEENQIEDRAWFKRAGEQFLAGSPTSIRLSYELLKINKHFSLAKAFQIDFNVAMHCLVHGDFKEGIRALIIDKDQQPEWKHSDPLAVPDKEVFQFLKPVHPENQKHPLHDLKNSKG